MRPTTFLMKCLVPSLLLACSDSGSVVDAGQRDAPPIAESTATMCANGQDDDGDGLVDCADQDCENLASCQGDGGQSPDSNDDLMDPTDAASADAVDAGHDAPSVDAAPCKVSENLCDGACVPNSTQSCGPACSLCPPTTNGSPTCVDGACGFSCDLGYTKCTSGCCARQATAVAAGGSHTCALSDGGAQCWGYNVDGELGNGNRIQQALPVDVLGLTAGVSQISASTQTTCAVTTAGLVKCWGGNMFGQLGPTIQLFWYADTPVDITVGEPASAVVTGQSHTCLVTTAGGVKCWGDSVAVNSDTPVDVQGLSTGVVEVAIGYGHACARTSSGAAKCWGKGSVGELGNSNYFHSAVPVDVAGLSSNVIAISSFQRTTCAIVTGGEVKCWGENDDGLLGSNAPAADNSNIPVTIADLPAAATALSVGQFHACALVSGGAVYCWGSNTSGRLGGGPTFTQSSSATPVAVVGLASDVVAISAGGGHSCALLATGGLRCWGQNGVGQLGDNSSKSSSSTPVTVLAFP